MEESEKRRDRLKAMRMEAETSTSSTLSQQQQTLNPANNTPLSNPLLLDNHNESPSQRPRFDFYTDPLAAFSSLKTPLSLPSPSPGSRNSEMSNSGVHQFQNSQAPHQNIHQGGVPYYSPSSTTRPMEVGSPYHGHQVRGPPYNPNPTTGPEGCKGPYPPYQGRPSFSPAPYRGPQFHNSPNPGLGRGSSPYPVNQGSPNFVPQTQGRGYWPNNSPSPGPGYGSGPSRPSHSFGSGSGRGRWDGGSGYSGGRRRGHAFDSQARSYYDRSMVEDPWQSLTPVVWQSDDDASFRNSWGSAKMTSSAKDSQGSVRMNSGAKKARASSTEPSLAEFLAAAADEADGNDAETV